MVCRRTDDQARLSYCAAAAVRVSRKAGGPLFCEAAEVFELHVERVPSGIAPMRRGRPAKKPLALTASSIVGSLTAPTSRAAFGRASADHAADVVLRHEVEGAIGAALHSDTRCASSLGRLTAGYRA